MSFSLTVLFTLLVIYLVLLLTVPIYMALTTRRNGRRYR